MSVIRNVKLELLRSGPSHNQLLSPLTPYIALCGAEGPVTINLPFEHRQLLNRLSRLRYAVEGQEIPVQQREAEVLDIGETLGAVLGEVPTLLSELSLARCGGGLIHLTLSVSALELGMVPFEFAIGSDGFPASGSPLFLQSQAPIAITREVRRGKPLPCEWNRPPRILFAFASPEGLPNVPADNHLRALRRAIDPWVKWQADDKDRCEEVKSLITVLPDATLKSIALACAETEFTHVHLLAHGSEYQRAGDKHYGLVLNSENGFGMDIVDGQQLAIALAFTDTTGNIRPLPTVVSLATCDSGNVDSVITPGGSIAHALHAGGVPWVFASQFPLWMQASIVVVETLYSDLLTGADPRWALYGLRQRLFAHCNGTHDWASIVAYASIPENFDQQVEAFRENQRRRELEVKFHIADQYLKASGTGQLPDRYENLEQLYREIRLEHQGWLSELGDDAAAKTRAEALGMYGAAEKRIGLLYGDARAGDEKKKQAAAFKQSCDYYQRAMEIDPGNHWVITQYLSMSAVLRPNPTLDELGRSLHDVWITARQVAVWAARNSHGNDKAGALASLAELELLGTVYDLGDRTETQRKEHIDKLCRELIETPGTDGFLVRATRRQFQRYVEVKSWSYEKWHGLAQAALDSLKQDEA